MIDLICTVVLFVYYIPWYFLHGTVRYVREYHGIQRAWHCLCSDTFFEKQAIWMLTEKRKSIRAIAKTKGMEKSRVWKPPATPTTTWSAEKTTVVDDRQIIKAVKMNPKRHVCKISNNFQKAGVILWQSTVLRRLWHRITDATQRDANLWPAPHTERQD